MRHNIFVEGFAFRLRPITDEDANFVIELRTDPALNRYLHASSNRIEDQLAWFSRYYDRANDYYFVLERRDNGAAEGVVSIYDIDQKAKTGEWGRWILKTGSLGAVECSWLIYRVAFESLKLDAVYCRTVADNVNVMSFHDSCGILKRRLLPQHLELNGLCLDAVEHYVDHPGWDCIEHRLEQLAKLTSKRILRG
ncbi:GNAT family N-acetyltransferase [Geobacter sp. SVR]|uniref:GNAT family N-acetyltransferase n=1 Tax=Geobacter sp. SVR TaxID=2495594 RepID=UPI00143EFBDB|nr:GNAT family N-acetyltransferase [Geobacter sp. SVR]BCS55002.1 hypothetical protein GSVR_33100 [Geobacter sp. SVR]GCF85184.1 hypothetical protein GSbR_17840 [Geobacter sp. SVR]